MREANNSEESTPSVIGDLTSEHVSIEFEDADSEFA